MPLVCVGPTPLVPVSWEDDAGNSGPGVTPA